MKLKLQTRGPKDKDWCNLTSTIYPTGHTDTIYREQRKAELYMDHAHQGWAQYFGVDHAFRVVKVNR